MELGFHGAVSESSIISMWMVIFTYLFSDYSPRVWETFQNADLPYLQHSCIVNLI